MCPLQFSGRIIIGGGFSDLSESAETEALTQLEPKHVIFATNNNFCPHAAEAIVSLLETNAGADITVHLFTIECERKNVERICRIVGSYHQTIKSYEITKDTLSEFPETGAYSLACYLRLFAPTLLPDVDKVLYLDCDLIVNGNLDELWNTDLEGYAVAAVHDATLSYNIVKGYLGYDYWKDGYFNSGMLLMNLKYWREHHLQSKLVDFLNTHQVALPDQDAMNIVLHGSVKYIHPKWNCHVGHFAFPPLVFKSQKKYIKHLWNGAKIVHFTGPVKPWYEECVNPYKKAYLKYRKITHWYEHEALERKEQSLKNSIKIIILRHCKNVVARIVSYTY